MKKYSLIVKEEADQEITDAYTWYENKSEGLGERFLTLLDHCFKTIVANPNTFQKVYKGKRQAVVQIFPFVVIYEKEGNNIVVFAVFHTSRNPEKWKK